MNKRIVSLLICFLMILSNVTNVIKLDVYAKENGGEKVQIYEKWRTISYDEAVDLLMEKEHLTCAEAKERLDSHKDENVARATGRTVSYSTYTKTYDFTNGYTVEIGGVWQVYSSGSFRQFNCLESKWIGADGSGSYTWSTYHITDTTGSYPTTQVSLMGRGCMEIAVNTSTSSGASLGSDLLGVGFNVSSTVGTTTYYRCVKDLTMSKSFY